jgi:hypothetical protein
MAKGKHDGLIAGILLTALVIAVLVCSYLSVILW